MEVRRELAYDIFVLPTSNDKICKHECRSLVSAEDHIELPESVQPQSKTQVHESWDMRPEA